MNVTKGTVYREAMGRSIEDEILERLRDQGVMKVERIKRVENGTLTNTNRFTLI